MYCLEVYLRLTECLAYVVAHELAHQWFGNLVTMDWVSLLIPSICYTYTYSGVAVDD